MAADVIDATGINLLLLIGLVIALVLIVRAAIVVVRRGRPNTDDK